MLIFNFRHTQKIQFEQYEKLTKQREKHLADGNPPECFTDYYLEEVKKRGEQIGSFTRRQMYFFQGDMFGAGTETSTHTILFAIMFLASDQFRELQTRIQAEIEAECGDDPPTLDHKLTLLRATVMEVQRLRPVTPQVTNVQIT